MYAYSLLTAEAFYNSLSTNVGDSSLKNCNKLWECLMYHLNYGLRSGGGIADVSAAVDPAASSGRYVSKFFYDLIFFILINIISLNIIFGIIIDTFADKRTESDARGKLSSNCSKGAGISVSYLHGQQA